MIADLADEVGVGLHVEVAFEIVARPPQVIFRLAAVRRSFRDQFRGVIRGARQVVAHRVERLHRLCQHFAAEFVPPVRVGFQRPPVETGRIDLVVARPQRQRRMVAQLADDEFRLGADRVAEFAVLRIQEAGQGEILPDQHSVRVAKLEEGMILVDVAAPAAQHVAVEVERHGKGLLKPRGVAAVQRVERHPVAPFDVDPAVVHVKGEVPLAGAAGHGGAAEADGADTDPLPVLRQHPAGFVEQPQFGFVAVGTAGAARPPEPGVGQFDHLLAVGGEQRPDTLEGGFPVMGEPDGEAEFSPLGAAGNQVPRQQHFGAGRIRVRFQRGPVDVAECGCRDGFEADAAPDPR